MIEYTDFDGKYPIMVSLAREILEVNPEHEQMLRDMIERHQMIDELRLENLHRSRKVVTEL